ncbi:12182_t:CDS:2, partial [Ambispora gerdemannii]
MKGDLPLCPVRLLSFLEKVNPLALAADLAVTLKDSKDSTLSFTLGMIGDVPRNLKNVRISVNIQVTESLG